MHVHALAKAQCPSASSQSTAYPKGQSGVAEGGRRSLTAAPPPQLFSVIQSLEKHFGLEQQATRAHHLCTILGGHVGDPGIGLSEPCGAAIPRGDTLDPSLGGQGFKWASLPLCAPQLLPLLPLSLHASWSCHSYFIIGGTD